MDGDYNSDLSQEILSYKIEDLPLNFQHFNELRESGLLCDAILKVCDKKFPVHRIVLASCSPYFHALFTNGMQECNQMEVEMHDVSPSSGTKIIQYVYSGRLSVNSSNVEEIMILGDKYDVTGVVKLCSDYINKYLSASNCFHYLSFASKYFFTNLQERILQFIKLNFEDIGQSNYDLLDLGVNELEEILSCDRLNVCKEEFLFETVDRWVKHAPDIRRRHLLRLLSCIRLGLVSKPFFENKIATNSFVEDNEDVKSIIEMTWNLVCSLDSSTIREVDLENPLLRPRMPNDVLFAIGGWSGGNPITFCECYDTRADRWYTHAFVEDNIPRAYHGLVTIGKVIYIIGGFDGASYFSSVRCFEPSTRKWKEVAPMHYQRCYVSVAVMDQFIYACGGYDGRIRLRTAEKYNPKTNQWSLISKMHLTRSDSSAAVLNGKLYVAGGFDGEECLPSAEVYDPCCEQWTMLAPMNRARSGVCLVAYDDAIYALGGFNGLRRQACGEAYDPDRRSWTEIPRMLIPRSNFAAVVMDRMIFVIGGFNGTTTIPHVECYDSRTNAWYDASDMHINRSALSACVVSNLDNVHDYTYHGAAKSDETEDDNDDIVKDDDDEDHDDTNVEDDFVRMMP